ncbi:hypothetical protein PPYR_00006, partial [Photinus pyralis]
YALPPRSSEKRTLRWFCNRPLSPAAAEVAPVQDGTINSSNSDIENGGRESIPDHLDGDIDETIPEFDASDKDDDDDYVPNSCSDTSSEDSDVEMDLELEDLHDKQSYHIPSAKTTCTSTSICNQAEENRTISPEISSSQTITAVLPVEETGNDLLYGKRNRQKDFCFFCDTLVQCFARHIIRNHATETEVQKILSYPPRSTTRKQLITMIRKKGNYLNSNTLQKPVRKGTLDQPLLPCSHCCGLYSKKQLWRHAKQRNPNQPSRNTNLYAEPFKG